MNSSSSYLKYNNTDSNSASTYDPPTGSPSTDETYIYVTGAASVACDYVIMDNWTSRRRKQRKTNLIRIERDPTPIEEKVDKWIRKMRGMIKKSTVNFIRNKQITRRSHHGEFHQYRRMKK